MKRKGGKLMMRFAGKHGIVHEVPITDSNLKRIVAKCDDLPGQHLFQYITEDGDACPVTSADVNDYIREASGGDFTAKNFRTWGASVIAFDQMLTAQEHEKARISLKTVLEPVAEALGNTVAISRKSYVHPKLIDAAAGQPAQSAERHGAAARPQMAVVGGSRAARLPRRAEAPKAQGRRSG